MRWFGEGEEGFVRVDGGFGALWDGVSAAYSYMVCVSTVVWSLGGFDRPAWLIAGCMGFRCRWWWCLSCDRLVVGTWLRGAL